MGGKGDANFASPFPPMQNVRRHINAAESVCDGLGTKQNIEQIYSPLLAENQETNKQENK